MDTRKSLIWTFSTASVDSKTVTPSIKIARFLSKETDIPVLWDRPESIPKKLETLFIVNGAYAFCKALPTLAELVLKAERIIWVMNDYSIVPPKVTSRGESPFRAAFRKRHERGLPDMTFWSTVKEYSDQPGSKYVNWNAMFYTPTSWKKVRKQRRHDVLYYGSFRSDGGQRLKAFDKYFLDVPYDVTISSSSKNFQRYRNAEIIPPMTENFPACLAHHGLGLYLEDEKSHREFHSPATRFYEMLSAGLPIVFQKESREMLRAADIELLDNWCVDGSADVYTALKYSEDIRKEQRDQLADKEYAEEVKERVRKLLRRL